MGFRVRRTRITCVTLTLILVAIFVALNVLYYDVNSGESNIRSLRYLADSAENVNPVNPDVDLSNDFHLFAPAPPHGQRKPKTTNIENSPDDDTHDIKYRSHKNKLREVSSLHKNLLRDSKALMSHDDQEIEDMQDLDDEYYDEDEEDYNEDVDEDEYDYDDEKIDNPNPVFKPGDFGDIRGFEYYQKPKLKYEPVKEEYNAVELSHDKGDNVNKFKQETKQIPDVIQNGLFWSAAVESSIPKGLSYRNMTKLLNSLHKQAVQTLDDPTWDRCGRPKNGFIILGDGTQMCVRYRHPHIHFVFGEALSFYLSRLLGMDNVPAVVLATTSSNSRQWRAVNISSLEWEDNKVVAFIQWIDNLNSGHRSRAYVPPLITEAYLSGRPVQAGTIYTALMRNTTFSQLSELAQWGTMIIFDYLTGNYDRVASMQDAADKDKNPHIMEEPIRNLRRSSQTKKLWLIDNESGLFDAYELLEPYKQNSRFTKFHQQMLQTMCVFQPSLVHALYKLSEQPSPHLRLIKFASSLEPLIKKLPKDRHYDLFVSMFENRLKDVISWIEICKKSSNR